MRRANRAHVNLVEQFAAFAGLMVIAHLLQVSTSTTVLAATVYFWARVVHAVIFIAGVNVLMARNAYFHGVIPGATGAGLGNILGGLVSHSGGWRHGGQCGFYQR